MMTPCVYVAAAEFLADTCKFDVVCRFKRSITSNTNKITKTILLFWVEEVHVISKFQCINNSKTCSIHLAFWMEVLCRFKGQTYSTIKDMMHTYLDIDWRPMPAQRLNVIEQLQKFETYLSFWVDVFAGSKVKCIQNIKHILNTSLLYAGSKIVRIQRPTKL
jgi:hypothetical protein